jgi:carbamoyl-phosphate synthase large subunit
MRRNTAVLITGAGGPAAIALIQAYATRSRRLFAGDIDPFAAGLYLVERSHRTLLLRGDSEGYIEHLLGVVRHHQIEVLVPTVDSELIPVARARAEFEALGCRVMVAPLVSLQVCLDKQVLIQRCAPVVPVPRSVVFSIPIDASSWGPLVFVKPRRGSGGRGASVMSLDDVVDMPPNQQLLVQELLPGTEYSVDVLVGDDGVCRAAVPRLRMKVDSGVAVTARTLHDAELQAYASRVAEAVGIRGVCNVQFKRDAQGVPKLLEVNARFPGTMPLTVRAGVDMPGLWLEELLGRPMPAGPLSFDEVGMVRTWHEHYIEPSAFLNRASENDDLARCAS